MGKLFTPITQGTASVSLQVIGAPIIAQAEAPSSPGIFRLALTPKQEGSATLVFTVRTGNYTDTLVVDGLTVHANAHDAAHAERPEEPAGDITYLKEQAWKIPFALERVQPRPFAGSVRVGAEVEPATSGEQVLAARSAGVVHLLGNAPLEGMSVKSGQALFRLSSQGITGENPGASVQQARNDYERAKADFEPPLIPEPDLASYLNALNEFYARADNIDATMQAAAMSEAAVNLRRTTRPERLQMVEQMLRPFTTHLSPDEQEKLRNMVLILATSAVMKAFTDYLDLSWEDAARHATWAIEKLVNALAAEGKSVGE